jgi:DNA-binding NtrC family response regulator
MRETVLIAEDETLIRLDLADTLQRAGYETLEASTADEAWDILQEHDDVCCLFTDIQMPGKMDGLQLAEEAQRRWPGMVIVIGSGNLRPVNVPPGAVFLSKPYNTERLTRVIGDMHRRLSS